MYSAGASHIFVEMHLTLVYSQLSILSCILGFLKAKSTRQFLNPNTLMVQCLVHCKHPVSSIWKDFKISELSLMSETSRS